MSDRNIEDFPDTYESCPVGGTFEAYGDGRKFEKIQIGEETQALSEKKGKEKRVLQFFFPQARVKILTRPEEPEDESELDDEELERLTDPNVPQNGEGDPNEEDEGQ